jgi:flagellar biogenesis protein FliO
MKLLFKVLNEEDSARVVFPLQRKLVSTRMWLGQIFLLLMVHGGWWMVSKFLFKNCEMNQFKMLFTMDGFMITLWDVASFC